MANTTSPNPGRHQASRQGPCTGTRVRSQGLPKISANSHPSPYPAVCPHHLRIRRSIFIPWTPCYNTGAEMVSVVSHAAPVLYFMSSTDSLSRLRNEFDKTPRCGQVPSNSSGSELKMVHWNQSEKSSSETLFLFNQGQKFSSSVSMAALGRVLLYNFLSFIAMLYQCM